MTAASTVKKANQTAVNEIEAFFERKALNTAPAWMPEPGTVMVGTVTGLRMGEDKGWGPYPIVVYKLDDGTYVSVHAFHTLMRNSLKELGTVIGKRQILSYDGKKRKNNAEKDFTPEEIAAGKADYHMYYVENAGENDSAGTDDNFKF